MACWVGESMASRIAVSSVRTCSLPYHVSFIPPVFFVLFPPFPLATQRPMTYHIPRLVLCGLDLPLALQGALVQVAVF